MPINGKNRSPESMTFNVVDQIELTSAPQNIAASQSIDTVIDAVPLTLDSKVIRVGCTAQTVSGSKSGTNIGIQIVLSSVPPTGPNMIQDAIATPGCTVFAATVPIAEADNYTALTLDSIANMNTVYPAGECLTLRAQSDASSSATGLRVFLDVVRFDGNTNQPLLHQLGPTDF